MSMEELFATAVDRLERNLPVDDVMALCTTDEERAELRELLFVVEDMVDLALQPAPAPSPVRRQASRALFLQTILEMQVAQEAQLASAPVAVAAPAAGLVPKVAAPAVAASPGLRERVHDWLQQFRGSPFGSFAFNMAPLAALLLAIYLATAWISSTAQASVPGEPAYRIKEWAREIKKELAAPEARATILRENDEEVQRELTLMAERAANLESVAPRVSQLLQYRGMAGRLHLVGPLHVLPNYQPDLQSPEVQDITIEGDLRLGVPVRLEYQVLPGNPNLVQGITIVVLGAPEPTPESVATPPQMLPTEDESKCPVPAPAGWMPLAAFPGDKVTDIAMRAGESVIDIMSINCLDELVFTEQSLIMVPDTYYIPPPTAIPTEPPPVYRPPAQQPAPAPTRRPTPTPATTVDRVPTPAATATDNEPSGGPTATVTDAPATAPAATATPAPTSAATATADASVTPDVSATSTAAPRRILADHIRTDPPNPRHPRSISII